jgi:Uma2 family endonuclease
MTPTKEPPSVLPEFAGTRRFTPAEYRWLGEADILGPYDRVELLDGYIIYKADFVEVPTDGAFPEWRLLRRWTADEYRRMCELGIIKSDERLELLDGYLVLKMPPNLPHVSAVSRLATRLAPRLPSGWWLRTQCPISIGLGTPEPDGAILRGCDADYDTRVPIASDFGIVIEGSDSSLELDRTGKGRIYARAGIPTYWIINVLDRQIEVYTNPDPTADPPAYAGRTDYKPGDAVPVVLDGQQGATIPVSELIA